MCWWKECYCATRVNARIALSSSRISESLTVLVLVSFDRYFTLVQNRFNRMSPSARAHCWGNIPAQFWSVSVSFITTDAELCSAPKSQCEGWVKSCRTKPKQNQTCFCGMPQSESELRELFKYVSQDFVKNTHKHAFRWQSYRRGWGSTGGGIYWSEVRCAFWSRLKWGFWQFSRSCFPLRLFF